MWNANQEAHTRYQQFIKSLIEITYANPLQSHSNL